MKPKPPFCEICGLPEAERRGQTSNHICQFGEDWDLKLCKKCHCMTNHNKDGCLKCRKKVI